MGSDTGQFVSGIWYPPLSNQGLAATFGIDDGEAVVTSTSDGKVLARYSMQSAEISERIGNIPRKVAFPNGSAFETSDNGGMDQILVRRGKSFWSGIHGLEQFHPRLIGVVAAIILFAFLIYRFALPVLVEVAVLVTPSFVPEMMAAGTLKTMDTTVMSASSLPEETKAKIQAGFDKLVVAAKRDDLTFKLNFRDGGIIGPNAFALPDGNLIITDQLVALASGDIEMLIGVLAHEIGHVEMEHSLRHMYTAVGTYGLVAMITGDLGGGLEDLLTGGVGFLALANSRAAETAADQRSVELMAKAGYDPTAISRFFVILKEKLGDTGETSMLSTHPGTPDREKAILEFSKRLNGN